MDNKERERIIEILEKIEQVTRDDVLELAVKMIEGRALGLTAVGNLDHFEPEQGKLVAEVLADAKLVA